MKKIMAIIMVASLTLLTGCNIDNPSESSEIASASICNNLGNASDIDKSSVETSIDNTPSSAEKFTVCHPRPKVYDLVAHYDDNEKKVDAADFFKWCKTVVVDETLRQEYPDNSIFIDYLNKVDILVAPSMRNTDYYLRRIKVASNGAAFAEYSFWYTNDEHTITVSFVPTKNNGDKNLSLSNHVKSLTYDISKATNNSPWGEYYTTTSSTGVGAYFSSLDYIIHIFFETNSAVKTTSFQLQYFDYFDFETVSLKD